MAVTTTSTSTVNPGITLQVVTERAQAIYKCLTDEFDLDKASQVANQLYQEGIQLVQAQVRNKPLFPEIASSVLVVLDKSVPLPEAQHQYVFHRALSKAYRVFAELTWYQCLHQKKLPVFTETRKALIDNSQKITETLPKEEIELLFEYRCARQAAKCLTPSESIWKKYLDHALNLGEAGESQSIFGVLKTVKDIVTDVEKDWIEGWYADVHYLRWAATQIKSEEDFKKWVSPELQHFKGKGNNHTLCLSVICMGLIQDPKVEKGTKKLAGECLAKLCDLVDQDRTTRMLSKLEKGADKSKIAEKILDINLMQKWIQKEDRYYLTRALIMQYVEKLMESKETQELTNAIIVALGNAQLTTTHQDEKATIAKKLKELATKKRDNDQFIKDTQDYLEPTRGEVIEESEAQKAKQEMEATKLENEEIDKTTQKITAFEKALDELNREEGKSLEKVKTLSS